MLKNQNGSIGILILLFVAIFVAVSFTALQEDRIAIAEEIKTGKTLVETEESKQILKSVDMYMDELERKNSRYAPKGQLVFHEKDWIDIFFLKVRLEQARLLMEIEANKYGQN